MFKMVIKMVFENDRINKVVVVTLAGLYVLGILTCTVSFFTPRWLQNVVAYDVSESYLYYFNGFWSNSTHSRKCDEIGLVSGDCRFPYNLDSALSYLIYERYYQYHHDRSDNHFNVEAMKRIFYCMVTVLCILYSNLALTLLALVFNLFNNRMCMAALAISYGVLYPIGAVLVLAATIWIEVNNPSTGSVGYSTILGTVSGGLMVLFYVGLRFYDYQYRQWRLERVQDNRRDLRQRKPTCTNHRNDGQSYKRD